MRAAWARLADLKGFPVEEKLLATRQAEWLQACLLAARDTQFGMEHGFQDITSPQVFRDAVPLRTYKDLRPWVDQVALGVPDVLFHGRPVAFEQTGGSEGGAKLIPYSKAGLRDFQAALRPWLGDTVRHHGLWEGSCYWVTSPALRESTELLPGVPMGLPDAAYLGEDLLAPLGELSALPGWVGSITEEATWRLGTMHALLVRPDLAFISLWSPTFLLVLLDRLSETCLELDELLLGGGVLEGHPVSPDPAALARLHAYRSHGEAEALWPRLRLISAWADGSSAPFAKALQERLPHAAFEPKGLLSTEGVISTPRVGGAPVLATESGFFEFLDDRGAIRFAHELEEGDSYEVVLTTASGLYRYRTGDAITCQGFAGDTPRLRFLGRLGLSSDLVGEKLHEAFVARCLEGVEGFRMLVPSLSPAARYCLVVDRSTFHPDPALLFGLDQRLKANPQYAHARHMGQLAEIELLPVSDPLAKFLAHLVREGRRPGDLKVPALHPGSFWEMIFRQESP